ncbi:hypothetical protein DFH08DRAFT_1070694 [Mycena albidolilacea]|uniref:MARVEL domain-containing protein n=1 Tax=Mycena albidolilacea TaxID=1033008 RepID=A0AAD7ATU7_9AGAR|nr:hypothetical protein DFH08DRAFT_1070694 [Mycena albidolilacea]
MAPISLIRMTVLSTVLAFAVIVVGLAASLTSTTEKYLDGYFEFAALAIATAGLTIITVPIMIALEITRAGTAFTSMIVVELSWLSILWVLWLATAADSAQVAANTFVSCSDYFLKSIEGACRQTSGIEAFAFLNWIILLGYTILILVLSLIAHSRQHTGVWKSSVAQAPFFTPSAAPAIPPATSQPEAAPAVSYGPSTVSPGGYEAPQTVHSGGAVSHGGTGPASVQAGTVHESV